MRKLTAGLLIVVILIISFGVLAFAIPPDMNVASPTAQKGFYWQGNNYTLQAYVYNSPSSVKFYCPQEDWISDVNLSLISTNFYQGIWQPDSEDHESGKYMDGLGYTGFWQFEFAATNQDGSDNYYRYYHVPIDSLSAYQNVDNQFSYTSLTVNDFDKPDSPIYNCAAYAVDVYDEWFNAGLSLSDAIDFMEKDGAWSGRDGSTYTQQGTSTWCNAVYYNGVHFAKVIGWSASGVPLMIKSKWGEYEVIVSDGLDAFESTYGDPVAYFQ